MKQGRLKLLVVVALAALCALGATAQEYTFTTLAGGASAFGSAGQGNVDGNGVLAKFNAPSGIAIDGSGNLYVADTSNNVIRKVTVAGVVTTFAGLAGASGSLDGVGADARFKNPTGIAADAGGNLYVADYANHTIRKITPSGSVTTLAGTAGAAGSADGNGAAASFKNPASVAVDGARNVYVADYGNHTIRRITPAGEVSTVAGLAGTSGSTDGAGNVARFRFPAGVAADSAGNVYVADYSNATIRKIAAGGEVSTLAGSDQSSGSTDGAGNAARFRLPTGVAVNSEGTVFVADFNNATVRRISPLGEVTTVTGLATNVGNVDGTGNAARFNHPRGVALDAAGNLYVADSGNNNIRKLTTNAVVTIVAGKPPGIDFPDGLGDSAIFYNPVDLAIGNAGALYVVDQQPPANVLRVVTVSGVVTSMAGIDASLSGVTADSQGRLLVTLAGYIPEIMITPGSGPQAVLKVDSDGSTTLFAGKLRLPTKYDTSFGNADGNGTAARFRQPRGLASDRLGNTYVADTGNNAIRKITPEGQVTTLSTVFNQPNGVAVDGAGTIYLADSGNHTIRKITTDGSVTPLAGLTGTTGYTDGTGQTARFNNPTRLAVDGFGNIFVTDTGNSRIRKITPAGVVTTIGGAPTFKNPQGIAVDKAGVLYIADSGNGLIRVGRQVFGQLSDAGLGISRAGNQAVLTWSATSGATLENTTNLAPPVQWTPQTNDVGTPGRLTTDLGGSTRFYRLKK